MNGEQRKRKDRPWFRANISHRLAVRTLIAIQEELGSLGTCSWGHPEEYEYTIPNMISKIRRLKQDSEKYHELQKVLQKIIE